MVPLGPVGVTAPVTHGNDDHAELGQRLLTRVRREELRHGLCLGTRIDVRYNRIALGRIEIVRLVHHPIDVGDAVRRLHLVRLRELVAGRGELGEIGDLEIHDLAAAGVEHGGCRHGVDLGVVVHEVPTRLVHDRPVIEVARVQQREAGTVQVHPVEVLVIGIFSLFPAVGPEEHVAPVFIHTHNCINVPRPYRQPHLHGTVGAVSVEVSPPVALRPPEQVAVVQAPRCLVFHVGIEPLLDDDAHLPGGGVRDDDVHTVLIAAPPPEVKLVRVGGQPLGDAGLVRASATSATEKPTASEAAAGVAVDPHALILPWSVVDAGHFPALPVEHEEFGLGDVLLTRQVVPVGLEFRPLVAHHVHDPEVPHLAPVLAGEGEISGVLRPGDP